MKKTVKNWDAYLWQIIDLDIDKEIKGVQWANDETGKYEKFLRNEDGSPKWDNINGKLITEVKKGKIKLVRKVGKIKYILAYLLKFINKKVKIRR